MRPYHFLAGNKGGELPHAAIWVDTETLQIPIDEKTVEHRLDFGFACYQRTRAGQDWTEPEWFRFTSSVDFWAWVEHRARAKSRLFIFAHNLSFDGPVLDTFNILPQRGWTLTKAVIESPPVILSWRREKSTILMLDTLNWWRMPLRKVGESIGIPKLEYPAANSDARTWDLYCKTDVEIIRRAMFEWWSFLARYDLGGFASTLASQAMRSYRHRFMPTKILIDADADAIALARSALHGGRTECFRIGDFKQSIHCLDVNSMYPAVMLEKEYPARLIKVFKDADESELLEWTDKYSVVARVDLETKRNKFAHLHDGKLIFPIGRFSESLTTPDLRDALNHGEIRKIHGVAVYEKEYLFADFVDTIYRLRMAARDAGNEADTWRLKILMNSLYGKFAQRGERWEVVGQAPNNDIKIWCEINAQTRVVTYFRTFGGSIQTRVREGESHDSHPAIAAHVTAYGRALLYDLIQKAKQNSVWYVDTDSLYVDDDGFNRLRANSDNQRLGSLKVEAHYNRFTIYGPKDYIVDGRQVCKGVRGNAVWLNPAEVEQEQWSTLRGLIRKLRLDAPTTAKVRKRLSRVYGKGDVGPKGVVSPFFLREW